MSIRDESLPLTSHQPSSCAKTDPTRVVPYDDPVGSTDPGRFSGLPFVVSGPLLDADGFPVLGTAVAGFLLEKELGRGSFGRAFLAQQQDLAGRPVVLKFSPAQFVCEAHTLARLQHTNIVPIFSKHTLDGLVGVCMPFFQGPTLSAVLQSLRRLPELPTSGSWLVGQLGPAEQVPARAEMARGSHVEACLRVMAGLADGLAHAHERSIVHRDIKPANVLLTSEAVPMLLDFNLAAGPAVDATDRAGGTLAYMAPEALEAMARREALADPRADLFGLGVVIFELLTGHAPYPVQFGPTHELLPSLIADRRQPPPDPRDHNPAVSPAVAAIVRRCLAPQPEDRYPSARALHEDVTRQLASLPLKHTPEPSLRERAAKWSRRHPRASVAAGVMSLALAVIAGLSAVLWSQWDRGENLEARDALVQLEEAMKQLPVLLSAPTNDPGERREGLRLAEQTARRYGLPDDPDWINRPVVTRLDTEGRQKTRQLMGQLLWLWGRALGWQGEANLDEQVRLNARARACFDDPPAALVRQHAELARRQGGKEEADRLLATLKGRASTELDRLLDTLDSVGAGRISQVMGTLMQMVQKAPKNATLWLMLSRAQAECEQLEQARLSASIATSLAPDWVGAWYYRGLLATASRRPDDAVAAFTRALELQPTFAEARMNRAVALATVGKVDEARDDLDKVLAGPSPNSRAWLMRSQVRAAQGDHDGAREDLARGLKEEPTDETGWQARATARLVTNDPAGALADLDQAIKKEPRSLAAWRNRAYVLSERFLRTREAVQALNKALEIAPEDLASLAGRAVLLARLGEREAALADCRAIEKRTKEGEHLYRAACARALAITDPHERRKTVLPLLQRAFDQDARWLHEAVDDPDLRPMHGDEAFRDLIKRAGEWLRLPAKIDI